MPSAPRRSAVVLATAVAVPVALIAGVFAFWQLGGFAPAAQKPAATGPVTVSAPPSPDPRCAALIAALPRELAGAKARPVSGAPEQAAAWGDPPIVLRCGVAKARVEPTAQLLAVQGIEWHTAQVGGAVVWTTTSAPVPVEVVIPDAYRDHGATGVINPLAAPLKSAFF